MTEDELNELSIDELFDELMQHTKQFMQVVYKENMTEYKNKKRDVELLQKIIESKRFEK